MSPRARRPTRPRPGSRAALGVVVALPLAMAGCGAAQSTAAPTPSPASGVGLSPEAAAIPQLRVVMDDRTLMLSGYDPTWSADHAEDRKLILTVAPDLTVERGRAYQLDLSFQAIDPVVAWLPPDFGHMGGSEPVHTEDGFVPDPPTSAFVRKDALPDVEAGLFGVKATTDGVTRVYAYPVWTLEPDPMPADAFAGLHLGISDEDGATAALTFIDHVRTDLQLGGGPELKVYATRADLDAAFAAEQLDAWIAIPAGWSDNPTTHNGFESGSRDPETGNAATDTGQSYELASLIDRALGRAGLVIDRGY